MNERLKELAEQAGCFEDMWGTELMGGEIELERFSELIRQDEREKFVQYLMDLHSHYKSSHNHYQFAANFFKEIT